MALKVVLLQLPIPPLGPERVTGNVPLAAGYLKYYCHHVRKVPVEIEILPHELADTAGDAALAKAIVERNPDVVGFSCYVWNAERSLALARQITALSPGTRIVVGGPEATVDNSWFLNDPAVDWAVLGEGEESFAELMALLAESSQYLHHPANAPDIPGVWNRHRASFGGVRPQLSSLDEVGRVYLSGMIDPRWHDTLFLESVRGCIFHCSFCFYPKSFDRLAFMSSDLVLANLRLAEERGISEVFLLDPTLNQRKDFEDFLKVLREGNERGTFTYSGELRAEGIRPEIAQLMRRAGFVEVELGLQSVGRTAQNLMHRRVNLPAFERGVKALMEAGIRVRVDLIVGLPGDTVETIREGIQYLASSGLYHEPQVFRLSVLPGTEFRRRSQELGLKFQPRPPYHVLSTPHLGPEEIQQLLWEAERAFATDFDPLPIADEELSVSGVKEGGTVWEIDLEHPRPAPAPETVGVAHTLWITGPSFEGRGAEIAPWVRAVLRENPHTALWVVLDVTAAKTLPGAQDVLQILDALYESPPSYWDWHFAAQPKSGRRGAKRIVVYSAKGLKGRLATWRRAVERFADIVEVNLTPQHSL